MSWKRWIYWPGDPDVPGDTGMLLWVARHKLAILLTVLAFSPFLGLLPDNLRALTFRYPALLVGPLLVAVPLFAAYHINWQRLKSPENLLILGVIAIAGVVLAGGFEILKFLTLRFACPPDFPIAEFDVVPHGARRALPVLADVVCNGDHGVAELSRGAKQLTALAVYAGAAFLCAAVALAMGRNSPLLGSREQAGELRFAAYFIVALSLCVGYLSLPEFAVRPAAGWFAPERTYPMDERRIAWFSPLHAAALTGDVDGVQAALAQGTDVNAVVNRDLTALSIAVEKRNFRLVRLLVEAGADVNLGEASKRSAMQKAFESEDQNLIRYLQQHGGNRLAVGGKGASKLLEAVEKEDLEAVRELIAKGASPNLITKDEQTVLYRTIFEVSTDYYKEVEPKNRTAMQIARMLLDHGARLDVRDRHGATPLVHAIYLDNVWMVRLFLERGADPNAGDNYGTSPVFIALTQRFFDTEMAALLLEHGADINLPDSRGRTPLILAAEHDRSPNTLTWLLKHGAQVNVLDASGQTALDKLGDNHWDEKKRKVLLAAGAKSGLTL